LKEFNFEGKTFYCNKTQNYEKDIDLLYFEKL